MYKNLIKGLLFLFFASAGSVTTASSAEVANMTPVPIVDLQISISFLNEADWSGNLLEGPLNEGESTFVPTGNDAGDCHFHVFARYEDGGTEQIPEWDFCENEILAITGALKQGGEEIESFQEEDFEEETTLSEEEMSMHGICTEEDVYMGTSCAEDLFFMCEADPELEEVDDFTCAFILENFPIP